MNTNPIPALGGVVSDPTIGAAPQPAVTPQASKSSQPATTSQPAAAEPATIDLDPGDYRLVIEDDKAAGSYVYVTIDRRTGEVVSQFPREQLLKLREAFDYTSGDVIKTTA